jgi:lambda repressor-like predicted transcriptional regulator
VALKTVIVCDSCLGNDIDVIGEEIPGSLGGEQFTFHFCISCKDELLAVFRKYGQPVTAVAAGTPAPPPKEAAIAAPKRVEPLKPGQKFYKLIVSVATEKGISLLNLPLAETVSQQTLNNWRTGRGDPSKSAVRRMVLYLDLDRKTVKEITGHDIPLGKAKPKYASFYDYVEEKVKDKGYPSVEAFAEKHSLALSTIENLRKKLPRGVTLQLIAKYLDIHPATAVRVYVALKNQGVQESEQISPHKGEVKAKCGEPGCGDVIAVRNRSSHARNKHRIDDPWFIDWELVGMPPGTEPVKCAECGMPFQSRYALQMHGRHTHHRTV